MGRITRRAAALLSTLALLVTFGAFGAAAQVEFDEAAFNAYATGSNVHGFLLQQGDARDTATRALQADAGFTGAAADSLGLDGPRDNDLAMRVHPDLPGQHTYARSSSLEGGVGVVVPDGPAEGTQFYGWAPLEDDGFGTWDGDGERPGPLDASAPPTEHVSDGAVDADGDPAFSAELLSADAFADWDEGCVPFLSEGSSEAADVRLLNAADDGDEWVAQTQAIRSYSATYLGPQVGPADEDGERETLGDHAAVYAQTDQTTADVTFFQGQEIEFTVRIVGTQLLRAVATGIEDGAYIEYEAPLVTVETPEDTILDIDVAGQGGTVRLPPDDNADEGPLLADISIFDEPYHEEVADDGTSAAASVDLVRVGLVGEPELGQAAEVRIGHMEVEAEAPEGGIVCEVPMDKTVDPETVEPGDAFTFTVTVDNPFDCDITGRVVDEISVEEGAVSWTVTGTDPEADEVSDERIVWEDVSIEAGGSAEFTIEVEVDDDSGVGVLRNDAFLDDAVCMGVPVHGEAEVVAGMPVVGAAFVIGPEVVEEAVLAAPLPVTGGGTSAALLGIGLAGAALLLSRARRSRAG
jgi:uncharacterized repeat protein (TIGR01451 family)